MSMKAISLTKKSAAFLIILLSLGSISCSNQKYNNKETMLGAIAGAAVGSHFGSGSGHLVGAAVGAVAGGALGSTLADENQ